MNDDDGCFNDCTADFFEFTFTDTAADDVTGTAIKEFFESIPNPQPNHFMFFEILGGGSQGAWCAEGADYYINDYIAHAGSSGNTQTGATDKWYRLGDENQAWQGPNQQSISNLWGTSCTSGGNAWCSNWGLGGSMYLAAMPAGVANSNGECYAQSWSNGANWTFTIRYATSRFAACGF
jgi:hypothetical protein